MNDADKADINTAIRLKAAYNFQLAQASNGARNGRLFCALIWASCIVAFLYAPQGDQWFLKLAVVAAGPIGIACVVDHMRAGPAKSVLAFVGYAVSAASALTLLLTMG